MSSKTGDGRGLGGWGSNVDVNSGFPASLIPDELPSRRAAACSLCCFSSSPNRKTNIAAFSFTWNLIRTVFKLVTKKDWPASKWETGVLYLPKSIWMQLKQFLAWTSDVVVLGGETWANLHHLTILTPKFVLTFWIWRNEFGDLVGIFHVELQIQGLLIPKDEAWIN